MPKMGSPKPGVDGSWGMLCDFFGSGCEDAEIARNAIRIAYAGVRTDLPDGKNDHLGALGPLCSALGSLSAALGPLLGALGGTFGRSWPTFGCSWITFGRSWDAFGRSRITFGRSWGTLGCS